MEVDWQGLENSVVEAATTELKSFARQYKGERFYGFAFDCNSDYAEILLSLNTHSCLATLAREFAEKLGPVHAQREAKETGQPLEVVIKKYDQGHYEGKLRWSCGDWEYVGFQSAGFGQALARFSDPVQDAILNVPGHPNEINENFMRTVCRALIRLEKAKAFDVVPRTSDFQTWIGDHDETDATSFSRMAGERQAFNRTA